jgi:hypothetical protein
MSGEKSPSSNAPRACSSLTWTQPSRVTATPANSRPMPEVLGTRPVATYTVLRDSILAHPTMAEGLNVLFSKIKPLTRREPKHEWAFTFRYQPAEGEKL